MISIADDEPSSFRCKTAVPNPVDSPRVLIRSWSAVRYDAAVGVSALLGTDPVALVPVMARPGNASTVPPSAVTCSTEWVTGSVKLASTPSVLPTSAAVGV